MKIYNLPDSPLVDENGVLQSDWKTWFIQLQQSMQANLSDDGYIVPSLSSDAVDLFDTAEKQGNLILDSGRDSLVVTINGTLYKLDMTPV